MDNSVRDRDVVLTMGPSSKNRIERIVKRLRCAHKIWPSINKKRDLYITANGTEPRVIRYLLY